MFPQSALSNAPGSLLPPPDKAKSRNASMSSALPTYRDRPGGGNAQQNAGAPSANLVSKSLNFISKSEALQSAMASAARNPVVQSMGRQAAMSMLQQQMDQKKAQFQNAFKKGETGPGRVGGPTAGGGSSRTAAERELEDIFGPSLNIHSKPAPTADWKAQQQNVPGAFSSFGQPASSTPAAVLFGPSSWGAAPFEKFAPVRPPPPKIASQMSPLTDQPHGIAKYRHRAANVDELSCEPSDLVLLTREVNAEWIWGRNTNNGEQGMVPMSFLHVKVPLVPTQQQGWAMGGTADHRGHFCAALYDFNTGMDGDLQFACGQTVTVLSRVNDEWLRGETANGQKGIFPLNFVDIDGAVLAQLPSDSLFPSSGPNAQQPVKRLVKALYDYSSAVPEDLSFRAGDVIEVLGERPESGWAMGRLGERTGLVPLTFVQSV